MHSVPNFLGKTTKLSISASREESFNRYQSNELQHLQQKQIDSGNGQWLLRLIFPFYKVILAGGNPENRLQVKHRDLSAERGEFKKYLRKIPENLTVSKGNLRGFKKIPNEGEFLARKNIWRKLIEVFDHMNKSVRENCISERIMVSLEKNLQKVGLPEYLLKNAQSFEVLNAMFDALKLLKILGFEDSENKTHSDYSTLIAHFDTSMAIVVIHYVENSRVPPKFGKKKRNPVQRGQQKEQDARLGGKGQWPLINLFRPQRRRLEGGNQLTGAAAVAAASDSLLKGLNFLGETTWEVLLSYCVLVSNATTVVSGKYTPQRKIESQQSKQAPRISADTLNRDALKNPDHVLRENAINQANDELLCIYEEFRGIERVVIMHLCSKVRSTR
ncbi:hypothetical protein WN51_11817 [Melipona quadrifasciata]|uniref:Uncharacterized protein n=1 Tax=Melipona quadrifasciata TaxID=166423 RepID=A0A0N0U663_9HYME|nr:hypothetical protein WN51_11817 [Melipona quadrifasciata]